MAKRNGPGGFVAVLPSEVIEIPQDSDKSWLTLFYCLPKELAGKWKPALDLPRCPYEVLRTDKYDGIVCDDMFKLLVWDSYQRTGPGNPAASHGGLHRAGDRGQGGLSDRQRGA